MPAALRSRRTSRRAEAAPARRGRYAAGRSRGWALVDAGERIAAAAALLVLLPALLLAGAVIAVQSGRSPLVAHGRVGRFGEPLWVPKLRTMWGAGRPAGGPRWLERVGGEEVPWPKTADDGRVRTRFARACRRWSLDELPQLLLVASGSMALVGPRPLTRAELDRHYGRDAAEVLTIPPGITGLWQVTGRNTLGYDARLKADLALVRHCSAALYARIVARTLFVVVRAEGAW
ncbi:MAG TPA: sugar transferase [Longimicrobium sp.]